MSISTHVLGASADFQSAVSPNAFGQRSEGCAANGLQIRDTAEYNYTILRYFGCGFAALWLGDNLRSRYPLVVPIFHECQRCTACCRWPGQVRVSDEEITRLAAFKGISELEFIQQFMRLRHDRRGLALQEKPNGECIFLDGNDCSVQPVKPQQCRDFPNLWNFPGFEKVCHAVPRLVNEEEYHQLVTRAAGR